MSLSKSIERQLARIETGIARREAPRETQHEQWERQSAEAWRRYWERYFDLINEVLGVMDTEFAFLALQQMETVPVENLYSVERCHETGGAGLLPPLASGVCRLAGRLIHQEGLTFPIPLAFPASICQFLQEHGAEVFRPTQYTTVGEAKRTVPLPQYKWLCGHLQCKACYYPVPYKDGAVGRWNLTETLSGPDTPNLPFKECPACGGSLFWV